MFAGVQCMCSCVPWPSPTDISLLDGRHITSLLESMENITFLMGLSKNMVPKKHMLYHLFSVIVFFWLGGIHVYHGTWVCLKMVHTSKWYTLHRGDDDSPMY